MQTTKQWLGMNVNRQEYYNGGRIDANWAKYGQRWRKPDGTDAVVSGNKCPAEPSSSVVAIGGWDHPDGAWKLKWLPLERNVTLSGPQVVDMGGKPGNKRYHLDTPTQMKITTDGSLTDIGLFPPGLNEESVFWPDAIAPLWKLNLPTLRLLDFNNIGRVGADTHDGWIPDWQRRPQPGDYRWQYSMLPWETQCQIATAMRAKRIWIQFPHLADKEYIQGMARVIAENFGGEVWCEGSNEKWNRGYPQGIYYNGDAHAAGLDTAKMFKWFCEAFPRDRARLVVMGHQADGAAWARTEANAIGMGEVDVVGCAAYCPPMRADIADWKARARSNPLDLPSEEEIHESLMTTLSQVLPKHLSDHRMLADSLDCDFAIYEGHRSLIGKQYPWRGRYVTYDESVESGAFTWEHLLLVESYEPKVYCHYNYMSSASGETGQWGLWRDYTYPMPSWEAFHRFATS